MIQNAGRAERCVTGYYADLKKQNDKKRWEKERRKTNTGIAVVILSVLVLFAAVFLISGTRRKGAADVFSGRPYSQSIVTANPSEIPDYDGEDYIILNNGRPCFNEYDKRNIRGEYYSELDFFSRCGPAVAGIDASMRPAEKRESIGMIKPSGWNQVKYEGLVDSDPPYLFNRCHLIAHALTGQNANEKNLITGTRYMNAVVMLQFETQVMEYLEHSGNHVLYRVTPYFKGTELVARGVEMEALSVEDNGKGVCFHVFIYNRQPGVIINYQTGQSRAE